MRAKIAKRGQVTIPKALRKRLGLEPGTVLELEAVDGRLVASKVQPKALIGQVYGILGKGHRTDAVIAKLRGNVD